MAKPLFDPRSMMNLPPGLSLDEDGTRLAFNVGQIPASHHFFYSTDFMVGERASQIHIVFGSRSMFSNSNKFDRAIEIVFPKEHATDSLVSAIWNRPGEAGGTKMFIEIVEKEAKKFSTDLTLKDQTFSIPEDPSNFRQFPSNLAASSIGQGQAMIEFFEASPGLLSSVINRGVYRPDDSVSSVVCVMMEPKTLYQLFVKLRQMVPRSPEEVAHENGI